MPLMSAFNFNEVNLPLKALYAYKHELRENRTHSQIHFTAFEHGFCSYLFPSRAAGGRTSPDQTAAPPLC